MAAKNHNRTRRTGSPKCSNGGTNRKKALQAEYAQNQKVNQSEKRKTNHSKWDTTQTGQEALKLVEENESTAGRQIRTAEKESIEYKKRKIVNWNEFTHLSLTWFVSAFVIAIILVFLSIEEQSTDLFHDVINRIDTLSLMFSLVLSAVLEQIWNHKKSQMFQWTLAGELMLAIFGLVWYLLCSVHEIQLRDPGFTGDINPVYTERFWVHAVYIVLSVCCVFVGFLARVSIEREER